MSGAIFPPYPAPHATVHEPAGADDLFLYQANSIAGGIETIPRQFINNSGTFNTTTIYLTYFTAPVAMAAVNNILFDCSTGGTTPAHNQVGLYTVDGSGNLTLVAYSTDSTSIFASNSTEYLVPLTTGEPYAVVRGQRYAIGVVMSWSTVPKLVANFNPSTTQARAPRLTGLYNTGSPTSLSTVGNIATGNVANSSYFFYAALLP